MRSDQYIPERMKKDINKATNSMIESGLQRFYRSFTKFLTELRGYRFLKNTEDDPRALTVEQLWGPLILSVYILCFATIILVIEIIVFKLKQRRNIAVVTNRS